MAKVRGQPGHLLRRKRARKVWKIRAEFFAQMAFVLAAKLIR